VGWEAGKKRAPPTSSGKKSRTSQAREQGEPTRETPSCGTAREVRELRRSVNTGR